MSKPLLSVCMITYGHEKYIADAIRGVLMQTCDFDFELLISDDCSPDQTTKVVQSFIENHPKGKLIRYIRHEKNLGLAQNFITSIHSCSGKYIAYCEGDDYWTDESKLQKQVNFLEANKDYVLSFHNAIIRMVDGKEKLFNDASFVPVADKTLEELLTNPWFIPTQSIVFLAEAFEAQAWQKHIFHQDFALLLSLALKGKFRYFNEVMSVYRRTGTSVENSTKALYRSAKMIELLYYFNLSTSFQYDYLVQRKLSEAYKDYFKIYLRNENIFLYRLWKNVFKMRL